MEGDMDDFGDIYADVEGYVNAGVCMIPSIRQLYLEDQAKAEPSPGDSEEEERLLYDRIGRGGLPDGSPGSAAVAVSDGSVGKPPAECAGGGGDDVVGEESNDSDSDDDLRIVLNEEDCNKFVPLPSVGLGNGGLLAGVDTNEEAKDESIIKNGVEQTSKEHKCADLSQVPVEGLEQSSLERGGSLKSGFVMPYSQFKYIRSQSAGHINETKSTGQGYVVPFTSPMTSRGDWDVSCLLAAASSHIGFPVPRNRTIFDISIESFDWKPWRNQGVDITDFFNFGLKEESWKQYCHDMVLLRKQTTWVARNSIYGSIRPDQAFDAGPLHGVESLLSEIAHPGGGTATSVVVKPKGKAIEVEGGSGERLPSVDIRRPRYQDSDVVIQIPVEYSDKDAKTSTISHGGHRNEEAVDCDKRKQPESRGTILREHVEKVQNPPDLEGIDNEKPDAQVFGTTFASAVDVPLSSCPSSPESISEASEGDFSAVKLQSPAKRSSLDSVAASDISVGSSCDTSHHKRVNDGPDSQGPNLYLEEQRSQSEAELCDVVEDDTESTDLENKGKHSSDSLWRYSRKLGKRSSCNHHGGENPPFLGKTKMSKSSRSWRVAEKWLSKSSHTKHSHRNEVDPSTRGNCHNKHNLHERRDCRHNDKKQTEHRTPKEDEHGWPMEFVIHKKRYTSSVPDHMPFGIQNDQGVLHRSRTADDHRWCVKPDVISKDRSLKEHIEGSDLKQFLFFDRDEAFQEDFDKNGRYRAWDKRSSQKRRERYDQKLCIDRDDSQEYVEDDKLWRYSNHRFFDDQTFRGSHGRVWHESSSPRFYGQDSWKSNEMHVGHCGISGARETQLDKQSQWDPCNMNRFSPYRDYHEVGSHLCSIKERSALARNTLFSEGRKNRHISKRRHVTEDEASLRHQVLDDPHYPEAFFSCESVFRHESCYGEPGLNYFHYHSLGNENGRRVPRKKGFVAKEQNYRWHRETVDGYLSGYEGKPLEKSGDIPYKKKKIRDDKMEGFNHVDEISQRKGNPGKGQKIQDAPVIHSTVEKVQQCDSVYCGTHCNEEPDDSAVMHDHDDSGLEEGQLVELEDDDAATKAKKGDTEETVLISSTGVRHGHNEKKKQVKQTSCNKEPVEYDKSHILETLAKMEKRRERFKEPIAPQKAHGNAQNNLSRVKVVSEGVKLERPTRKRRWGAVKSSAA